MRRKSIVAMTVAMSMFVLTFSGCSNSKGNKNSGKSAESETKTVSDTKTVSANISEEEQQVYDDLFNIENSVTVKIDISQEELDKLQDDYEEYESIHSKSPIYRKADKVTITVGDQVYEMEEVGIRLKGNMSRKPVYDEETGEPNICHYKLSFNETFDDEEYYGEDVKVWDSEEKRQERKDRTFASLKKMELKWNGMYDDTHIREYYATEIFRKEGVLVQHMNLSSLDINGDNYGVIKIYEPIDKIFIERNLPQEDWGGDLYKCGWTMRPCNYVKSSVTYGIEDKDAGKTYNYDLKTNKKSSNHESLEHLLEVLNKADMTSEEYAEVLDTDYLAKFLAVSYFCGDPDDMRNNYNNHYLYFLKSSGKAIFIPYDNDRCFGLTMSWNPDGTGMTEVSPYSDEAIGSGRTQMNPIIEYGILEDGFIRSQYTEELKKVAAFDEWNEANFEEVYEIAKGNYEDVVKPSIHLANQKQEFVFSLEGTFTSSNTSNMSFSDYVQKLMETFNSEVE